MMVAPLCIPGGGQQRACITAVALHFLQADQTGLQGPSPEDCGLSWHNPPQTALRVGLMQLESRPGKDQL